MNPRDSMAPGARPRPRPDGRRRPAAAPVLLPALLSLCLTAQAARAQEPAAPGSPRDLTETQSVRLALEHSGLLRAAQAEAAAAEARMREARAASLPAIRAAAGYTRLGGRLPDEDAVTVTRDYTSLEIAVEQPLLTGGRLRMSERAAERSAQAARLRAEQEGANVAFEVRSAYWTLHGALAALDATDAALAEIEAHVRDVQILFDQGTLLRSDLLAARTRRSEVVLQQAEQRNAARLARLELNRLLALPASTETRPVDTGPEPAPPIAGLEELVSAAGQSPLLRSLAAGLSALQAQAAAARGGRLPELALSGRYLYARPNPYSPLEPDELRGTWEAGVSLRWPLCQGGAQAAREEAAGQQALAAEARLAESRDQAAVQAARRYIEAEHAASVIRVAGENVEQAGEALRVTRQQFAAGAALSAQVLEAERAYREAQVRLARARTDLAIGRAALRLALGEVW